MDLLDTHQHLIYRAGIGYGWTAQVPALAAGDFTVQDYRRLTEGRGVTGSIFMETGVDDADYQAEARLVAGMVGTSVGGVAMPGQIASIRPETEAGFDAWLEEAATDAGRADVATIVVYIDDTTILTHSEVEHLVNNLRLGPLAVTTRVVIVTANPAAWDGCGFSGYVTSSGITTPSTAALTFLTLASDVAPETFTCLEFDDFGLSADGLRPSLLIEAS